MYGGNFSTDDICKITMRRSTKSLFKFVILSGVTIGFTIISFKILRKLETQSNYDYVVPESDEKHPLPPAELRVPHVNKVNIFITITKIVIMLINILHTTSIL